MLGNYEWANQGGATYTYQPHKIDTKKELIFSPLAYLKLQYMCQRGNTEVAGFGITLPSKPLYVDEFVTLPQVAGPASFQFEDGAQSDFMMAMFDRNPSVVPENSSRIWIHTHPGASPSPSSTDETTLDSDFADQDWVVMCIMARFGAWYSRLRMNTGPGADIVMPVEVDWKAFPSLEGTVDMTVEMANWEAEYMRNIRIRTYTQATIVRHGYGQSPRDHWGPTAPSGNTIGFQATPARTTSHTPTESVAPGLGVPAALFNDVHGIEDTEFKVVPSLPAPAVAAPPAVIEQPTLDTPAKISAKAEATSSLYQRVLELERRADTHDEHIEELQHHAATLLEYEDLLDYLMESIPGFDGARALEEAEDETLEITELGDDILNDDSEDDNEFAALNRLRAQEMHDRSGGWD